MSTISSQGAKPAEILSTIFFLNYAQFSEFPTTSVPPPVR